MFAFDTRRFQTLSAATFVAHAAVVELADTIRSGRIARKGVEVRILSAASQGTPMHSQATVAEALRLRSAGLNNCEISRRVGAPRSTVRDWSSGKRPRSCLPPSDFIHDPSAYVYLLGLYLGDGCISAHPRGVFRLRITLDVRYPAIAEECEAALQAVLPLNRVARHLRQCNCYEISTGARQPSPRSPLARPDPLRRLSLRKHGARKLALSPLLVQQPLHPYQADLLRRLRSSRYSLDRGTAAPKTIYVSRKADVARLDKFIGPKR